jgi:hypothetical protein
MRPLVKGKVTKWTADYRELTVLGVCLDAKSDKAAVAKFARDRQMTWPQSFDGKGFDGPLAQAANVKDASQMVVVVPGGKMLYKAPPTDVFIDWAIRAAVMRVRKPPTPAASP